MQIIANILLVEDNADSYKMAAHTLKESEFSNFVHWCKDGQNTLDYLHRSKNYREQNDILPNLIVLNLNTPGIDRRQFSERIKQDDELRATSERCYKIGTTYIRKPVNFDGLTEAFRTLKNTGLPSLCCPNFTHQE